jgi:hypothetical protein
MKPPLGMEDGNFQNLLRAIDLKLEVVKDEPESVILDNG